MAETVAGSIKYAAAFPPEADAFELLASVVFLTELATRTPDGNRPDKQEAAGTSAHLVPERRSLPPEGRFGDERSKRRPSLCL